MCIRLLLYILKARTRPLFTRINLIDFSSTAAAAIRDRIVGASETSKSSYKNDSCNVYARAGIIGPTVRLTFLPVQSVAYDKNLVFNNFDIIN